MPPKPSRLRLLAVLLVGPLALALLFLAFTLFYHWSRGGITGWLADALNVAPIRIFGRNYVLKILLPLYLGGGIAVWLLTLLPLLKLDRAWARGWRAQDCLVLGFAGMFWMHALLWWQVPTALWTIPGLRRIPFVILLPGLASLPIAIAWVMTGRRGWSVPKRVAGVGLWLLLWPVPAWLPQLVPPPGVAPRGGDQPCQVLMVGLDGLRSDVFLDKAEDLKGIRYQNSYTPIPATRLLWHIMWGGDPLFYTVGHVGPSVEEYQHPDTLVMLKEAKDKGWAPRFYIDDGGTIGMAERQTDLDDFLAPAEGWENFVNSNLAVSFPLYAVWENWFKPFPTTNPWAPLDAGLKEALRLGRGSKWVMFHSCLAHQPIFLNRRELSELGRWWALPPIDYQPASNMLAIPSKALESPDSRTNPFSAYRIRMKAILHAWEPIWNRLDQDPGYKGAVRVMFSDHGERFHNIGPNGFQLQGIHGFSLDPWECRTAMLVAGHGFSDQVERNPREASVSLLGIRDGTRRLLAGTGDFDAAFFEKAYPVAPIRYHTLDDSMYTAPDDPEARHKHREMSDKEIAAHSFIGPYGLWYTEYEKPADERAKDVSVGMASGPELTIYKPLKDGGADCFLFKGYVLTEQKTVSEEVYAAKKAEVEKLMPPLAPMIENGSKPKKAP